MHTLPFDMLTFTQWLRRQTAADRKINESIIGGKRDNDEEMREAEQEVTSQR